MWVSGESGRDGAEFGVEAPRTQPIQALKWPSGQGLPPHPCSRVRLGALRGTSREKSAGKQQPAGTDASGPAVTETPTGAVHTLGLAHPGAEAGLELGGQA